jgi:hypothetical protein
VFSNKPTRRQGRDSSLVPNFARQKLARCHVPESDPTILTREHGDGPFRSKLDRAYRARYRDRIQCFPGLDIPQSRFFRLSTRDEELAVSPESKSAYRLSAGKALQDFADDSATRVLAIHLGPGYILPCVIPFGRVWLPRRRGHFFMRRLNEAPDIQPAGATDSLLRIVAARIGINVWTLPLFDLLPIPAYACWESVFRCTSRRYYDCRWLCN